MIKEEIRGFLFENADENYKIFKSKLIPGVDNIIGVRIPVIKKFAKKISLGDYKSFLESASFHYHEERLLYGLVLSYIKEDIERILFYLEKWIPFADNWEVTDSGICNLKTLGKEENKKRVWEYLMKKLEVSQEPYTLRVIILILFVYFKDEEYLHEVITIFKNITSEHYYVQMALAWGLAEISVKNYPIVLNLLKENTLSPWVQNKTIQKCKESFRLTLEQKNQLQLYKI